MDWSVHRLPLELLGTFHSTKNSKNFETGQMIPKFPRIKFKGNPVTVKLQKSKPLLIENSGNSVGKVKCVGPENIHTPPTEGIGISWEVGGGGGAL